MARVAHLSRQQTPFAIELERFSSESLSLSPQSFSTSQTCHPVDKSVHLFWKPYVLLSSLTILCVGIVTGEPAIAQAQPSFVANVTLNPKFTPDPLELRGVSGGEIAAKTIAERAETQTGACNGFVDTKPDHTVVLSAFFDYLSLQVQSPQDTTLVIKGPGGVWCNDDHEGKNPGVSGEWLAGTYQVWIGSYHKTKYVPYILKITGAR